MLWNGFAIKRVAKDKKVSLASLATQIGVSRQTVNDWINGQIPKGNHLLALCRLLREKPEAFFKENEAVSISVPAHRKRKSAKMNPEMRRQSLQMAKEYDLLFKGAQQSEVVPVIRVTERTMENAVRIANSLRFQLGLSADRVIDLRHLLELLDLLGIFLIFRKFPNSIKSYAFYSKIYGHRVVFVNTDTNLLDLFFPLLHEAIHATRDEVDNHEEYEEEEEEFCDNTASFIQFPENYVENVHDTIKDLPIEKQIEKLKAFSQKYQHSLYGLVKRIKGQFPDFEISEKLICKIDTLGRKQIPSLSARLFSSTDPRDFVDAMFKASPKFMKLVSAQADSLTDRKLGELLGLASGLDAREVRAFIEKKLRLDKGELANAYNM